MRRDTGIDTHAMVRASMYCTLSSNRVLQTRTHESETFPSTRYHNRGGFITKDGFTYMANNPVSPVDFFTRCPYAG